LEHWAEQVHIKEKTQSNEEFVLASGAIAKGPWRVVQFNMNLQVPHGRDVKMRQDDYIVVKSGTEIVLGRPQLQAYGFPDVRELLNQMHDSIGTTAEIGLRSVSPGTEDTHALAAEENTEADLIPVDSNEHSECIEGDLPSDISDQEDLLNFTQRIPEIQAAIAHEESIQDMLTRARLCGASEDFISIMTALVRSMENVFKSNLTDTGPALVPDMIIELKDNSQLQTRMHLRRFAPLQIEFMQKHIDALLESGVVEPSTSSFISPVLLVRKADSSWRFCIDLRKLNAETKPTHWPLPKLDQLFNQTRGAKVFATFDLLKGYWQFPIKPECRHLTAFATPFGTFQFARVVMGARNSASHFQRIMMSVLGALANTICVVYLDDILVYARTEEELSQHIDKVLNRLRDFNISVQPKKCALFRKEVVWCGRQLSAEGVTINPAYVDSVRNMKPPTTAGELLSTLAAANWVRDYIPAYAEVIAPLQTLLTSGMSGLPRRTKAAASKVSLDKIGWDVRHNAAFNDLKAAIVNATTVALQDPEQRLCLFTDASDFHWGAILTQVPVADRYGDKQVSEWRHTPLAFLSGSFKGASLRWATPDKEGYAVVEACKRLAHMLYVTDGFTIYTDHRNLQYIYNPAGRGGVVPKPTADRLERWALYLRTFEYTIAHIAGEDNVWADLLSRWAHGTQEALTARRSLRSARMRLRGGRISNLSNLQATDGEQWPTLDEIRNATRDLTEEEATKLKLKLNANDLWMRENKVFYVPPQPRSLRVRICIVAHSGSAGHRRRQTTLARLKASFWWPTLQADVDSFLSTCLLCAKTATGGLQPRPLAHQMRANEPRQLIHFDFIDMSPTPSTTFKKVLVIKDDFSLFAWFMPTVNADSDTVVDCLTKWFATFGVAEQWVSDQGTHFKNEVVEGVRRHLHVEHHFTTAYSAWSNGVVERMNRELVRVMRLLMAEANARDGEWVRFIYLAQAVCNNTPSHSRLGGLTPHEVMFGTKQLQPLDSVLGTKHEAAFPTVISDEQERKDHLARIQEYCATLSATLHASWSSVRKQRVTRSRNNEQQVARHAKDGHFDIGSYVLVYSMIPRNKLRVKWLGPFQIVDTVNDSVYKVKNIVTGKESMVHAQRIRAYADASLDITEDIIDQAANDSWSTHVDSIIGVRLVDGGEFELKVKWLGFEETTWEPLQTLHEDVPEKVLAYLQRVRRTNGRAREALAKLQREV
jgi:hypothetical protein